MVMPLKPDGSVWVTTDLSTLNKFVVPSCYPLLLLEDIFLQTWGSKYFMKLDLIKAIHQFELHSDSRPLTTTLMPLGPHQYCHFPLGLKDSGAVC